MAKKKITLEALGAQMQHGFSALNAKIEKGFAAVADDIADLRAELKGDLVRLQEHVNSIETQLKHGRFEARLGDLEEEVFGGPRR